MSSASHNSDRTIYAASILLATAVAILPFALLLGSIAAVSASLAIGSAGLLVLAFYLDPQRSREFVRLTFAYSADHLACDLLAVKRAYRKLVAITSN